MNELGAYYLDPDSPNADPARGLRYLREFGRPRRHLRLQQPRRRLPERRWPASPPDPQAAYEWFRKAADGGHPPAPGNIGRLWNSGALGEAGPLRQRGRVVRHRARARRRLGGANGAWIIVNRGVPGHGLRDAALRAAKAAVLRDADSAAEARALLAELPPEAIDGAAQLLAQRARRRQVDGRRRLRTGERRRDAARARRPGRGGAGPDDPPARALALAEAYWKTTEVPRRPLRIAPVGPAESSGWPPGVSKS